MNTTIQGRAYVFGDNIDTDQIYPGRYLELTDAGDVAAHMLEGADPDFRQRFQPGGIVVAGSNFGCGSSREHAVIALQSGGVSLVVAESFARIFFRNSINLGFPLLICPGVAGAVSDGQSVAVDLKTGELRNQSTGRTLRGEPLTDFVFNILNAGGVKPLLRKQYGSNPPEA